MLAQICHRQLEFFLSTRPDDYMGEIKDWDEAEKDLNAALKKEDVKFEIKEKDEQKNCFYNFNFYCCGWCGYFFGF